MLDAFYMHTPLSLHNDFINHLRAEFPQKVIQLFLASRFSLFTLINSDIRIIEPEKHICLDNNIDYSDFKNV